jgi:metal-dependent amidase/aminoacylase/carboxypeptidase family protein
VNAYPECTQSVVDAATPFVGKERASKPQKTMAAEDFSYFLQERPGFEEKNIHLGFVILIKLIFCRLLPICWSWFARGSQTSP